MDRVLRQYQAVCIFLLAACLILASAPAAFADAEDIRTGRKLTVLEPEEGGQLDPAFDLIMEKLDSDINYFLSAPFRMTPKATAYFGVTILTTIYLLDFDDEYLDDISSKQGSSSDRIYERLNVAGSNIPEIAAGMYLLGSFVKSRALKSKSLQGLEASALTALFAGVSGYFIGHAAPDQSASSGNFRSLTQFRSMPDLSTALSFSFAGVLAYDQRLMPQIVIYGLTTGIGFARLYDRQAWPSDVFLGAVMGITVGRTVAHRSRGSSPDRLSIYPTSLSSSSSALGVGLSYKF